MRDTQKSTDASRDFQSLVDALHASLNGNLTAEQQAYFTKINELLSQTSNLSQDNLTHKYLSLLNSSQDSLFLLNRDFTIQTLNETAAERMGGEIKDFIGKPVFSFFSKELAEIRQTYVSKAFHEKSIVEWEDERNGVTYYNRAFPIPNPDGTINSIAIIAKNITEQKSIENDLHEKTDLLATALDINQSFVWEVDLESQHVHVYDYSSTKIETQDFPSYKTVEESRANVHIEDKEIVDKAIEDHYSGKTDHIQYEARVKYPDGNYYWNAVSGSIVEYKDKKPKKILGVSTNIHEKKLAEEERKSLENQLYHSQKMEAIGRLAGGISHDFNNLLTAVIGQAELAKLNIQPGDPVGDDLNNILDAAQRAGTLAKQLLTISRKQKHNPKVLNINNVINNILPLLSRITGDKIQLELNLCKDLVETVIDPSQIDQIIVNLIVNARDAISGNGKVFISTDTTFISEPTTIEDLEVMEGHYVCLSISDTGCGMSREVQKKVFEPFFTTKPEGKGTGLGLATVYSIVRQNKGTINLYSEMDAGTTFKIYLPVSKGFAQDLSSDELLSVPPSGKETVLVIEDDDAVRTLTIATLHKYGYTTVDASSSSEAQTILENASNQIDLIIADVFLPDTNGPEFIKENPELIKDIKVMYISGYTSEFIKDQHPYLSSIDFLGKPFRPIELLTTVRNVLDN